MADTEVKKVYEFRQLKADDLFLVLNLVKKINLKSLSNAYRDGLDEIIKQQKDNKKANDKDYAEIGAAMFNVAQVIIERITECKDEIYALLEATSNLSLVQIKDLDIATFITMIKDFVTQKEFTELFTQAIQLFNTEN
ncbi:MAG: hypothetical protein Q4C64_02370 [Erysipelotrichia bacterium]|nr:hypothetical protein [Erysipelotrichia bacterium]